MYCLGEPVCELDVLNNDSPKMTRHHQDLIERKASYQESDYVDVYTFEEYVYIGFGAVSEEELIKYYYVKSTLQPIEIFNMIKADDWKLLDEYLDQKVQEAYDNYFSLNVNHLLVYVDRDENAAPDDYQEFVASQADLLVYETFFADFEAAIINYLNESEENTFQTLITTYNRAKRTDPIWGEFKNFGFYLMTENLSANGSLTYANTDGAYEKAFVDGLIQCYQEYNLEENVDKAKFLYEEFIETVYGRHIIQVAKGTNFVMPSAEYSRSGNDTDDNLYHIDLVNTEIRLSLAQMKIYAEYRYFEMIYGNDEDLMDEMSVVMPRIPDSVKTALQTFFKDIYDSVYVIGTINSSIATTLLSGTIDNQNTYDFDLSALELTESLTELHDIYFSQVFPEYEPNQ
jgi:hypothetical protein